MAVRYILGRAGKGKSRYIFKEIEEDLRSGGEHPLILLVPEQFTLQAERDLLQKLGLPGIMRLEVLSFSRLARRVFEEVGGLTRTLINEQGKNMVLRKIIDENAKELGIYQKACKQEGFIAQFSELLSDLKQQEILPADLQEKAAEMEEAPIARQKLQDIALIYESFNAYLQERYIDTEDYFQLFINKIEESAFLKNSRVWIDAFSTFSPQSRKIVGKIMRLARDTAISFTIDTDSKRDRELFALSHYSYRKIHEMAQEEGLEEEIIHIGDRMAHLYKKPEILHLERELYAYPAHKYPEDIENMEVFAANNIYTEIENMAARLLSLVRDKTYRWQDIAVVCNDMDNYGPLIKRVFNEYKIPYFMDQKRDIITNPIIELILSSLDIIDRGYRYNDVFTFLKTGFSDLDIDECEKLENYALSHGIQGKKWQEEFRHGDELLEDLERCRVLFLTPLEELHKKVQGRNSFLSISQALYEYLERISIPDKLQQWIEELRAEGHYELVNENTQIWNTVIDIFDQTAEILGDQEVKLKEYRKVLETGFLSLELGIIPTTIDQVLVGNIQRSKSHDIKGLFVLGVNDGVLPAAKDEEGILSPEEKELLQAKGLALDFQREMNFAEERFLIYSAFSKAADYLWISYALADAEGKALRPSLLIDRCQRVFPALKIRSELINDRQQELEMLSTPESSFKYLVQNLRGYLDGKPVADFWWDVYAWYCGREEWQELRNSIIDALFYRNQPANIGQKQARRLYKAPFRSSVSRLEQFVNCPFAHFVRYGLKAQERKIFEVKAPDIGEIFHNAILTFAERLTERNIDWHDLQEEECGGIMDTVMDELVTHHGNGVLSSTHRYKYLVSRLKRISRRAIWTLTEHIKKGEFQPLGHELRFGKGENLPAIEIELGNEEKIYLEGRIDRLDLLEDNGIGYVKIIDYKSGEKKFSLSDVYYGLSLQLLIYLSAVLDSEQELQRGQLKPAGIFYFKIDDPMINSEEKIVARIEQEIARKLKMKGLVLEDVRVVRQMDREIQGYSEILPVAVNKKEEFYSNSSVISEEDFLKLIGHVKNLLQNIGQEIMDGRIKIEPVKNGNKMACDYCLYSSICQFDKLFTDNKYRSISELKDVEVASRIRERKYNIAE